MQSANSTQEQRLDPRKRRILAAVVREYVRSALPVASDALVRRHRLEVSSATVRNELAELEELGLLTHPHTSAGRVPTDRGYRFFIEWLMTEPDLDPDEQMMVRHQFHQVQLDAEEWSRLAASVLARLCASASLVTMPQAERSRVRHLELVPIQGERALLVVVLDGGAVLQQLLQLPAPVGAEELHELSARLGEAVRGSDTAQVRVAADAAEGTDRGVLEAVGRVLEEQDLSLARDVYHDGLLYLLEQPEFSSSAALREMLALLEDRTRLGGILPALREGEVRVVVGEENPYEPLRPYSLVFGRYGSGGGVAGYMGVVGPTRMDYARSIGAVRYVGTLMSELLRASDA